MCLILWDGWTARGGRRHRQHHIITEKFPQKRHHPSQRSNKTATALRLQKSFTLSLIIIISSQGLDSLMGRNLFSPDRSRTVRRGKGNRLHEVDPVVLQPSDHSLHVQPNICERMREPTRDGSETHQSQDLPSKAYCPQSLSSPANFCYQVNQTLTEIKTKMWEEGQFGTRTCITADKTQCDSCVIHFYCDYGNKQINLVGANPGSYWGINQFLALPPPSWTMPGMAL